MSWRLILKRLARSRKKAAQQGKAKLEKGIANKTLKKAYGPRACQYLVVLFTTIFAL